MLDRGQDALQLQQIRRVVGPAAPQIGDDRLENRADRARPQRQARVEVAAMKRAAVVLDGDLLVFEHAAVLIAQHRQQDLVGELGLGRIPVDVEEPRRRRAARVLEHVLPVAIFRRGDAHVVRHHVHEQAHAARAQRGRQRVEILVGADLRVQARRIDDVVAVQAARARGQKRRGVDVGDAERVEIGDQRRRVAQREVAIELKPIGGERDARLRFGHLPQVGGDRPKDNRPVGYGSDCRAGWGGGVARGGGGSGHRHRWGRLADVEPVDGAEADADGGGAARGAEGGAPSTRTRRSRPRGRAAGGIHPLAATNPIPAAATSVMTMGR